MTDVTEKKLHACKAAGISRQTAYRWQRDDPKFADAWYEAHEQAVDEVESVLFQKALSGDTICLIFYLKAHRPIYCDRLNIDIAQVKSEIEERMAQLGMTPEVLAKAHPRLTE